MKARPARRLSPPGPAALMLVAAATGVAALAPAARAAEAVVCEARWTDATRQRSLPVRIHLPAAGQPVPVVVYSPGLGGDLGGGLRWAQAWARAGLAVLQLQHPGSDADALRSGSARDAMSAQQFIARIEDLHFVIDQLQAQPTVGDCALSRIDPRHIGVAGHSFGALTAQAIAGQHYDVAGAAAIADRRVMAALALSPAPPGHGSAEAAFATVRLPFLAITGTRDAMPGGQPADREQVFRHLPPGDKWQLVLQDAQHADLAGRATSRHPHAEAAVIEVSTAFWRATLLADEVARRQLQARPAGLADGDRWEGR
ncbi:hypothetical protein MW290_19765 [Aquincola tertiaricarbonis]|uniref:Dienelactone hydrolase n=1 Tax=Aquincola tertiaricarbonis TaxID=391953 RepID=A0ABY4SCZ2_AQUTE|nr:hypothetical protein [Aquincola tertiaricarbonis]URI11198.1 hypothetical protein MW290_19765 [Aquincola tertiaricarbonis]